MPFLAIVYASLDKKVLDFIFNKGEKNSCPTKTLHQGKYSLKKH